MTGDVTALARRDGAHLHQDASGERVGVALLEQGVQDGACVAQSSSVISAASIASQALAARLRPR
jgi:hypothetical protein